MLDQLLAVAGVLGILILSLYLLRSRGLAAFRLPGRRGRPASGIEVLDRIVLTTQHSLHLVRLADRAVLIGVSPGGCSRLAEFEWSGGTSALGKRVE